MLVVRFALIMSLLSSVVFGQGPSPETVYPEITLSEVNRDPNGFVGRRVALTGEIVSVSANYESIHLFDGPSRAMISVSLDNLKKARRRALVLTPVRRLSVYGRLSLDRGHVVLMADRIEPVSTRDLPATALGPRPSLRMRGSYLPQSD